MTDWTDRAVCRQLAVERGQRAVYAIFFPLAAGWRPNRERVGPDPYAAAKAICARCPTRRDCADWALSQDVNPDGVFGGLDPEQRAELRRRPRPAPPPGGDVKWCADCGAYRPVDDFYRRNDRGHTRLSAYCKPHHTRRTADAERRRRKGAA